MLVPELGPHPTTFNLLYLARLKVLPTVEPKATYSFLKLARGLTHFLGGLSCEPGAGIAP